MPSLQVTRDERSPQIKTISEYTNPRKKDKIYLCYRETFEKCSILFEYKEGENSNHRNIFNISRIGI